MARHYIQGQWQPQNRNKYKGDINSIVYRSSWERRVFDWLDKNPAVVEWASEHTVVPYICQTDGKQHRYFVDITMKVKLASGVLKTYLVEIKPYNQTLPPKFPGKNTKRYLDESHAYIKNQCKWKAAKSFALDRGAEFVVITERELKIGKPTKSTV